MRYNIKCAILIYLLTFYSTAYAK